MKVYIVVDRNQMFCYTLLSLTKHRQQFELINKCLLFVDEILNISAQSAVKIFAVNREIYLPCLYNFIGIWYTIYAYVVQQYTS